MYGCWKRVFLTLQFGYKYHFLVDLLLFLFIELHFDDQGVLEMLYFPYLIKKEKVNKLCETPRVSFKMITCFIFQCFSPFSAFVEFFSKLERKG